MRKKAEHHREHEHHKKHEGRKMVRGESRAEHAKAGRAAHHRGHKRAAKKK